jgi:hypothetical protein
MQAWEDDFLTSDQKGRVKKWRSARHMCEGNHTSWIHPTALKSSKHHHLLVPDHTRHVSAQRLVES